MNVIKLHMGLRNIKRLRFITSTLVKHGFYPLLDAIGLSKLIKVSDRLSGGKRYESEEYSPQVRLRLAFEELGPTFIKLGQILSTRPDIIPEEFISELLKLQDEVPRLPYEEIKEAIETEFKRPVSELFISIDREPIAAASIAQVHGAITPDGKKAVVKVRRPGIERILETDVSIVKYLASLIERYIPESRIYDPTGIADDFAIFMKKELDFTLEASHSEKFRSNFRDDPCVKIPKVYWELSRKSVLTMERIDGTKIDNIKALKEKGIDTEKTARLLAEIFFRQVFEQNLFHGDLHSGNIFVISEKTLGFVDFGLVGWVDREMQDNLADILIGLIKEDFDALTKTYLKMGMLPDDIDVAEFKREHTDMLQHYLGRPFKEVNIGDLFLDYIKLASRHKVRLPRELILLDKCLLELEGLIKVLHPGMNLIQEAEPYAKKLVMRRLNPARFAKEGLETFSELTELLKELPRQTNLIIRKLLTDKLTFEMNHRGLEELTGEIDRGSNRLTFALILAALIVGSSLVIAFKAPPLVYGYPLLGILGFGISGFLGVWLAFLILKSGKY